MAGVSRAVVGRNAGDELADMGATYVAAVVGEPNSFCT